MYAHSAYTYRHALFSVTLFYACAKGWQGRDTRVRAYVVARSLDGRMAMAEVRESKRLGLRARVGWKAGVR